MGFHSGALHGNATNHNVHNNADAAQNHEGFGGVLFSMISSELIW
jgi:hypothetical protein